MYVREVTLNVSATEGETAQVGNYELVFTGTSEYADGTSGMVKQVDLDVHEVSTGRMLGHISPSMEVSAATNQSTLDASVITLPLEDLFVAFQGMNADGSLSIHVKVNPLILLNWIGAGVTVAGIALAFLPRRATPLLAADER